jgi:hypothetical protein
MKLTPAIKGQLTKARGKGTINAPATQFRNVRSIFTKLMPAEQAKHATRRYLENLTA